MPFVAIVNNLALLLALSITYGFLVSRWQQDSAAAKVAAGILFGLVAVAGMLNPLELRPGLIFDGRSVLLSVAGLFFGPLTAMIAAAIALCYRLWLLGVGVWSGVASIALSSLMGVGFHYRYRARQKSPSAAELLLFGLCVHAALLLLFLLLLPAPVNMEAAKNTALPFLTVLPLSSLLLFRLIEHQNQRVTAERQLKKAHAELETRVRERTEELRRRVAQVEELNRSVSSMADDLLRKNNDLSELSRQLEGANHELRDFAHVVSHDLKAPLRAVSQLAFWIAEDYRDRLDEEGRGKIDLLISRVKRMDRLIAGILAYSRIGRIPGRQETIDVHAVLTNIVQSLAVSATITISVSRELPVIRADRTHIEQIFQNLLSNAVKFMDKEEGRVEVGGKDLGDRWQFWVADNGPGISPDWHEKIFRIFQTMAPADSQESTGIGLTIVKKIVEAAGGSIWVESEEGKGSTFFFTLAKDEVVISENEPRRARSPQR